MSTFGVITYVIHFWKAHVAKFEHTIESRSVTIVHYLIVIFHMAIGPPRTGNDHYILILILSLKRAFAFLHYKFHWHSKEHWFSFIMYLSFPKFHIQER
jgi:hypothetical protein